MQNSAFDTFIMNEVSGYQSLAIHPGQINTWYTSLKPRQSKLAGLFDTEELAAGRKMMPKQFRDNSTHGKISDIAKKKITKAVKYITHVVPKKKYYHPYYTRSGEFTLNFITLTLSSEQIHTDNEIKSHILEPFFDALRRKWKICSYIWRAEKQANGSIHFHIIADRFIPWNELRNHWNLCQQKLGYITRYRDNQITRHKEGFNYRPELEKSWPRTQQYKAFQEGLRTDWSNPNSTDVHSLRHIGKLANYLTKYITKQNQSANIQGRLWGSSSNLVKLRGGESFAEGRLNDEIDELEKYPGSRKYKTDYFSCLFYDPRVLYSGKFPELLELLESFIKNQFAEYRPPSLL